MSDLTEPFWRTGSSWSTTPQFEAGFASNGQTFEPGHTAQANGGSQIWTVSIEQQNWRLQAVTPEQFLKVVFS
jgi:hypothetical protein